MKTFTVAFEQVALRGDYLPGARALDVLMLHGAGKSARARLSMVRTSLQKREIGTTSLDFIGHGETGGELAQSSVASRTRQAQAVIASRELKRPLAVIGFSMGASNAIRLAQLDTVSALILIVPGVYTPEADEVPFGPQFSEVIRRERSWVNTDAWEILTQFRGRLLVIAAENDVVIPREIPQRLYDSAINAQWRKLLIVERAEHNRLFSLLKEEDAPQYEATIDLIAECIGS
jgi:pimeloyl-ACP methyl ester carboxylesterase